MPITHNHRKKRRGGGGTSNTKSRVYFWRTILFFQACFCHYHSWSSSCLKSAGRRTAQRSLCTEWDVLTSRWWGKQVLWLRPSQCQRGRKRDGGEWREGGSSNDDCESSLTLFPRLDPDSVWLVFISTSRCRLIRRFSLSRPWSVCGAVFMSNGEG